MIFEVSTFQIEALDESGLVALLRRLIQAELNKNSIPLRSGSTPAQITIPDGGEDGRVSWSGGVHETDFLPNRFTVFQSKKGKISDSSLRLETQTKSSQRTDYPVLSEALTEVLSQSGAYVVITNTPVVGTNIDKRINAIKKGITETGNDPSKLSSIAIYDCNMLAVWANTHPAIALWINTLSHQVNLGGFQSFNKWGGNPEITHIEFQQTADIRFRAAGAVIRTWQNDEPSISRKKSFTEINEVVSEFFLTRGNAARINAPSGFGKTRFVYQLVASEPSLSQDVLDESQIVYCVYEDVKDRLVNIAREIVDSKSRILLIVDDCPDNLHIRLSEIVHHEGSRCQLVTIGVETKAHGIPCNLIVELYLASDELIDHIAKATNQEISSRNKYLIRELSQGYPKMAVCAARALEIGDDGLSSVDTLMSRIIWGEHEEDCSALESLQLLSFFTVVGMENSASDELNEIASFCGNTSQSMYQKLNRFVERRVLFRQGDYGEVQPLPLAMRLCNQWLESVPAGTLEKLFRSLSKEMRLRMVGRLRWVAWSEKVASFTRKLLPETLPDVAALDSRFGSKILFRFVHLAPDITMSHLNNLLTLRSVDELTTFEVGRGHTILALEKLAFRRKSFEPAARLLLILGATENENCHASISASAQFISLFNLYLSGTEATPTEKLLVLDSGLANADERIRKLCVKALDRMLESRNFSRPARSGQIGSSIALEDWQPDTYGDIHDYLRSALSRLEKIALNIDDLHSDAASSYIASNLKSLLSVEAIFNDIQNTISRILKENPEWYEAIYAVNKWLYFDRNKASSEHKEKLRTYYDELLPSEVIDKIYFYSNGWAAGLHDPDCCYSDGVDFDFESEYGSKMIKGLVDKSQNDAEYFFPLVNMFLVKTTSSTRVAVVAIAKHVNEPDRLLRHVLKEQLVSSDISILSSLTKDIISGAGEVDRSKGIECLEMALSVDSLTTSSIDFIAAVGLDDALMQRVVQFVKNDVVEPHQVAMIASRDILKNIDAKLIKELVDTLQTKKECGAWVAIGIFAAILQRFSRPRGQLLDSILQTVTNPALQHEPRNLRKDWYQWCNLIEKLFEFGRIDEGNIDLLADYIIGVAADEKHYFRNEFDDYAQKILRLLISKSPGLVWDKYHDAFALSDCLGKHNLQRLFGANSESPSGARVLNDIPKSIYIPWMLKDKNKRISTILSWIQLFIDENIVRKWSPDFVSFIDAYVDREEDLDVLNSRLTAGGWIGALSGKHEYVRCSLVGLRELSTNQHVHRSIDQMVFRLEQQICDASKDEANRQASDRA